MTLDSSILHSVETNSQKCFNDSSDFIVFSLTSVYDSFIFRFMPQTFVVSRFIEKFRSRLYGLIFLSTQ